MANQLAIDKALASKALAIKALASKALASKALAAAARSERQIAAVLSVSRKAVRRH